MTLDRVTRGISIGAFAVMGGMVVSQLFFSRSAHLPTPLGEGLVFLFALMAVGTLGLTAALAPRAVVVSPARLTVERRWWPNFEVPLRVITGVEEAPAITIAGRVRRVAGNGGLLGYTGLYQVRDVGLVRCWATRLGVPTVLVRRGAERPLLLGVDDPQALLRALQGATRRTPPSSRRS